MLELNLLGFQIILKFKCIVFIYNPTAPLTVKAQVYITGTGGVAHAYPSYGNHLLYRNRRLTVWNEFHEIATSSDLLSSNSLDASCHTFGPHWHTLRDRSCVDRLSLPCESRRRN